jgi:AcrR family transcriptional regulator
MKWGRVMAQQRSHGPNRSGGLVGGRERLLIAATAAFAQSGFQGASTRAIARAAGVTDPLLYHHFPAKADLFCAVVRVQLAALDTALSAALLETVAPAERLGAFANAYLSFLLDEEPGRQLVLRELLGLPQATVALIEATYYQVVIARLVDIIEDGIAGGCFRPLCAGASATAIISILHGFLRRHARHPTTSTRRHAIEQVLEGYVAGLLMPAA